MHAVWALAVWQSGSLGAGSPAEIEAAKLPGSLGAGSPAARSSSVADHPTRVPRWGRAAYDGEATSDDYGFSECTWVSKTYGWPLHKPLFYLYHKNG